MEKIIDFQDVGKAKYVQESVERMIKPLCVYSSTASYTMTGSVIAYGRAQSIKHF